MDIESLQDRRVETTSSRLAEGVRTPSVHDAQRAKSSLRLKYEAERQVIERKLGSLESIRESLGLSQRKMAQLLLVDPSAWTRWTKGAEAAPPHVYRMLQWYLALEEKYPALDVNFWLNTVGQPHLQSAFQPPATRFGTAQPQSPELDQKVPATNPKVPATNPVGGRWGWVWLALGVGLVAGFLIALKLVQ